MNQIQILLSVSALLLLDYSLAFSMTSAPVTLARYGSFLASPSTSTCLFAEEEEEASSRDAPQSSNDDPSTDILNSPAFLKRKIDVLKSDIAKTEEDIAAAKQRLEEGKAEWGGQLDELQKEVSDLRYETSVTIHRFGLCYLACVMTMVLSTNPSPPCVFLFNFISGVISVSEHSSAIGGPTKKGRQYGHCTGSA